MCLNSINNICTADIHNLLKGTSCDVKNAYYRGDLFRNSFSYPIFEGEQCLQYIREYVPFHLPQIVHSLQRLFENLEFVKYINGKNYLNILDLGSGPATVELAFMRLLNKIQTNTEFRFTTLEASRTFNSIIEKMKNDNRNSQVRIINNVNSTFNDFSDNCENQSGNFDWLIMANFLAGIGQGKNFEETNNILDKLISKLLVPGKNIILTIIETKNTKFFNIPVYLSQNNNFESLEVIKEFRYFGQISTQSPLNCCFYRTKYSLCNPYVNTKTLILKLK
jgi:ribosomal protein RSM22 (predicted rRNA methylase)